LINILPRSTFVYIASLNMEPPSRVTFS
jgi:hypothetical protein